MLYMHVQKSIPSGPNHECKNSAQAYHSCGSPAMPSFACRATKPTRQAQLSELNGNGTSMRSIWLNKKKPVYTGLVTEIGLYT